MNKSFPNASQSFKKSNPAIFGPPEAKNDVQPILGSARGAVEPYEDRIVGRLQRSESEPNETEALDSADEGEAGRVQRTVVRFTGYRTRPLDPDNFSGGCKDLLDGLRHAGLISGDEPWKIRFETAQVKVAHRSEERTEIIIEL